MTASAWFQWLPTLLQHPAQAPADLRFTLFSADTDRTQDYVFESDQLPEIRGGSLQLTFLNREATIGRHLVDAFQTDAARDCLIYAGGGSVLAILPDADSAQALAGWLQAEYARVTTVATASYSWREFTAADLLTGYGPLPPKTLGPGLSEYDGQLHGYRLGMEGQRKHFGDLVLLMGLLLRRAKQEKRFIPSIETMPFAQVCQSCQTRPAYRRYDYDDNERVICEVCDHKRQRGASGERDYWIHRLYPALQAAVGALPPQERLTYPQDIAELLREDEAREPGTRAGDLAFVYADGDSTGNALNRCHTPQEYRDFSHKLEEVTRTAVARALAETLLGHDIQANPRVDEQNRFIMSWEVITIGGDDVLILLPSWAALDFATVLSSEFSRQFEAEGLHMSVGFAIGQSKMPVRLLRNAAYKALRSAKRRAYQTETGCIDFHNFVKEGHIPESLDAARVKNRTAQARHGDIKPAEFRERLYGRPYTLDEARALRGSLDILRQGKFPRSQLYQMAAEMEHGEVRGSLFYDYQYARLTEKRRQQLASIHAFWGGKEWPWLRRTGDPLHTVLLDLLDLL